MTICVAIKVHDCIVFAADSASSLTGVMPNGSASIINVWTHGIKVFNLHKKLPIAAMTCGLGHFGPASINTLAKDLRIALSREDEPGCLNKTDYTIEGVTSVAHAFFKAKYEAIDPQPANPHTFEFWIGGYGSNGARGEIWKLVIVNGQVLPPQQIVAPTDDDKVAWAGQPQAINRLLIGFDDNLENLLVEGGLPADQVNPLINQLKDRTQTPLVHAAMPIQNAIELADFLVDITKRYFAFLPGADIVGGNTDIATVTKHEGFKWIRRKHYYPANLNPRETDHAT